MKFTALSKSVRAIGAMVLLSVVIGANISKTVQAQTQNSTDSLEQSAACERALQKNDEAMEGGYFFDDFQGLNLTDQQRKAYDALDAQAEARRAEIFKQTFAVPDPSLPLAYFGIPGVEAPPDVQAAVQAALDLNPRAGQEAALNERFGNKYGFFVGSYITYLTPEQEAQRVQITSDFYRQVQGIMTPAQQPQYSRNLAGRIRINAVCDGRYPLSSYPGQGIIVTQLPASYTAQLAQLKTIVELAAVDRSFSTLATLVTMAGLAETLSGDGPFTVFAPTNEAFAALPKGTLANLLKPESRELLRQVLTYHVVSGDLMAQDLRSGQVATVAGRSVAVQVQNGSVKVNDTNVVQTDVDARNGVIHGIDRVLLPPNL